MTTTAAATRSARKAAAQARDLGLTGVVPPAPALSAYVAGNARQADVVALSGARTGVTTVTRRDTGVVIGTVTKLNDVWFPTMPGARGVGSGESARQIAVGRLIDRAVLADVDEDEAVAARDEREAAAAPSLDDHPLAGATRVRFKATGVVADVEALGVSDAGQWFVSVDGYAHVATAVEAVDDAPEDLFAAGRDVVDEAAREDLTRWADEVEARGIAEAIASRAAAADEARWDADHSATYSRGFESDPFVTGLVAQGEDEAAGQAANAVAKIAADRAARARTTYRRSIASELVNVEGDLDEHADESTARDVLDLFEAAVNLVEVGTGRPPAGSRGSRHDVRRLVGFKANDVEREDLDLVSDYLASNVVGVATPSDAIRYVLRQYAALVRAAQRAR